MSILEQVMYADVFMSCKTTAHRLAQQVVKKRELRLF
jgi:hypothetical protein